MGETFSRNISIVLIFKTTSFSPSIINDTEKNSHSPMQAEVALKILNVTDITRVLISIQTSLIPFCNYWIRYHLRYYHDVKDRDDVSTPFLSFHGVFSKFTLDQ